MYAQCILRLQQRYSSLGRRSLFFIISNDYQLDVLWISKSALALSQEIWISFQLQLGLFSQQAYIPISAHVISRNTKKIV